MNKKTAIQLFLLSIVLVISLIIFLKYFNQETSKNNSLKSPEKKITEILDKKSNIISDIEYFSKDDTGNVYKIIAETGKINDDDADIIYLNNVKAQISTLNSEDIFIQSDFAKYNSKNYDTNFYENVKVEYIENKITCKYLDLLFNNNQAILYENIVYKNLETSALADRLEIDLITKNSKISMKDGKEKIKIVYIK